MPARGSLIPGILLLLPLCGGQEPQGAACGEAEAAESAAPSGERLRELGKQILAEAREVLRLLGEVTDRVTADSTIEPLRARLKAMDAALHQLKDVPYTDEQDALAIRGDMTELTHLSQAVLEVAIRLEEVGAYGSQGLLEVFEQYKLGKGDTPGLRAEDLPHSQLCNQLADEIEDALYTLRKIHGEAEARDTANTVEDLLVSIERTRNMLAQLAPPRTNEQREALEPSRERLRRTVEELRKVNATLQEQQYWGEPQLGLLLERLLRAAMP